MDRESVKAKIDIQKVIFSLLFSSYQLFGMSLTYLFLIIYIFYTWFLEKKSFLVLDKGFLFFLMVVLMHEVIMLFMQGSEAKTILNNIIGGIITVAIIGTLSIRIDLEKLKKAYYIIAIIVSIGILYHAVLVYGLGRAVTPIKLIPALISDSIQWERGLMRPMSCFIEPQAYCTFMVPVIFFLLNDKKIVWAALGTGCILLSTSSLGIIMCVIMWLFLLLDSKVSRGMKICIIFCGVMALAVILQSPIFHYAINKIRNIDTSSDARLSQGFIIYRQMPHVDQIFGIGKRSLVSYILDHNIYVPRMRYATNAGKWSYVTTIAGMCIYYGVVGIFAFLFFTLTQLKKKNFLIKEFLILLVAISFGQAMLFSAPFIQFYTILFCLDKDRSHFIRLDF